MATITHVSFHHPSAVVESSLEDQAYGKVTWRLLPFLFACYVFAYLDRVNVGFAKLQMIAACMTLASALVFLVPGRLVNK